MYDRMLRFFNYDHLPRSQHETAQLFYALAAKILATYPSNPERTVTIRKLLEAKDEALRCRMDEIQE